MRKLKVIAVLLLVGMFLGPLPINASGSSSNHYRAQGYGFIESGSAEAMTADILIARPVGLVATVVGSAMYVVSLPFSLLGGNEKQAREKLVKEPTAFTFTRPLGEFESLD